MRVTVNLPGQLPGVCLSSTCATVTAPPQLSVASTAASLAAGTWAAHWTVLSGAHWVITGAVVSLTVIVWVQVALLPQRSEEVRVGETVSLPGQLPGVSKSAPCGKVTV